MDDEVECPHCREINKFYPFPIWVSIFGFLIVIFVFIFLYAQYVMVKNKSDTCLATLRHHTK